MQQQDHQPSGERKKKRNPLLIFGPIAAFVLAQGKTILTLLKLGKFGGAIVSMFLFIGTYAVLFPLWYAFGLVVMLLIHETGHIIAAKRKGMPVTAPVFIPFLGALIMMKRNPRDAVTEAYIGYGGPLLGTIGAVGAYLLAVALDSPVLFSIAYTGFFLNLFNLIPVHPLDGGRISVAVTRWLWLVGLIVAIPIIIYYQNMILIILWAILAWSMYDKYVRNRGNRSAKSTSTDFFLPVEQFLLNGHFIPGEAHQRDLAYTTFSDLSGQHEGRQVVRASWHGVDFEEEMLLREQATIQWVYATAKRVQEEGREVIRLTVTIEYKAHVQDHYYDVPSATRWKFGFAYAGLVAFLVFMMIKVQNEIQRFPING